MTAVAAGTTVTPGTGTATVEPDWDGIVETIHRAVGPVPIFLTGSRATGAWDSASDYDIVVVLPLSRIPRSVARLAEARITLERLLVAPVSLNPLPAFQLWRSATNLFVWKLHTEGTVLFAPDDFPIERPAPFQLTATSAYSYLMTSVFVLLDAAGAPEPTESWSGEGVTRGVRKALLHIVQLRLLRQGDYAPTLAEAMTRSQDPGVAALLAESSNPRAWFAMRGLLLSEIATVRPEAGILRAIVRNAQYASLSRLRGQNRVAAVARTSSFEYELADAAARLLEVVDDDGTVNPAALETAMKPLPVWLHAPHRDWRGFRDVLRREWASAHALAGL
jgi:predicted nucleotidyltransferase